MNSFMEFSATYFFDVSKMTTGGLDCGSSFWAWSSNATNKPDECCEIVPRAKMYKIRHLMMITYSLRFVQFYQIQSPNGISYQKKNNKPPMQSPCRLALKHAVMFSLAILKSRNNSKLDIIL